MPATENSLNNLPEDSASLKALLCAVIAERDRAIAEQDRERRRAEEAARRAEEQEAFAQEKSALAAQQNRRIAELARSADELYIEKLRLQMELARYRKWTYGPRADRLSEGELLQALLDFGVENPRGRALGRPLRFLFLYSSFLEQGPNSPDLTREFAKCYGSCGWYVNGNCFQKAF